MAFKIVVPCKHGSVVILCEIVPIEDIQETFSGISNLLCRKRYCSGEDVFVDPWIILNDRFTDADGLEQKESIRQKSIEDGLNELPVIFRTYVFHHFNTDNPVKLSLKLPIILLQNFDGCPSAVFSCECVVILRGGDSNNIH